MRNACDRLEPVSTLLLMSIISREKRGLLWPRATMSNDCSSGTPALQHRRELAREERDVLLADLAAAAERLALDLGDPDALAAQVGRDDRLRGGAHFAANLAVVAVHAFPEEGEFLDVLWALRGRCAVAMVDSSMRAPSVHSLVTASISSSDVMPCLDLEQARLAQVAHAFASSPARRCRSPCRCA